MARRGGLLLGTAILCATLTAQTAHADKAREAREFSHQVGVQLGGSAFAVLNYRFRPWGPLWLDLGVAAAPHAVGNATAGLVIDCVQTDIFVVYAGAGATAGILDQKSAAFGYGRIGVGWKVGSERRHRFSLEVGGWWGAWWNKANGVAERHPLLLPVAGLSYLVAF